MQVLFSRQTGGYSTVSCPGQLDRKEGEEPAGFPRDCGLCLARVSAAGAVGHIHPSASAHPAFFSTCAGCSRNSSDWVEKQAGLSLQGVTHWKDLQDRLEDAFRKKFVPKQPHRNEDASPDVPRYRAGTAGSMPPLTAADAPGPNSGLDRVGFS